MKTLVTLTGPSCGGKTTLENALKAAGFETATSVTTRPMREGEVDGKAYYFVTTDQFVKQEANGDFIETVSFNGNKYGITTFELQYRFDKGAPVVLVVEPDGLSQIHKWAEKNTDVRVVSVFIDCPEDVISSRFTDRLLTDFSLSISKGREAVDKVMNTYKKRLAVMMTEEQSWWRECNPLIDFYVETLNEKNTQSTIQSIQKLIDDPFADISV